MEKSITSVQSQARLSFASHEAQRLATGGKAHFRLKVKRLRTLTLSALLMTAATGAWAQDKLTVLTVDDITVANGEETEIVINLDYNASQNMAGVNFSLYLPNGLLLKGFDTKEAQDAGKASALKKACALGEDGVWGEDASDGWLNVKQKADGGLLFTLIDQDDHTPFESTNAKLVTVHVHAVANIVNGEGLISTIGLKNENNESVEEGNLADVKFYVNKATAPAEPTEPFVGTVSLNDGTQNPATWTAKAGTATEFSALPLTGVTEGQAVTLKYDGRMKVKSVTATTDAAPAPAGITVARAAYQGTNAPSQNWTAGDKLYVYGPGQVLMGTLEAEADGAEAFMAGKLDFTKTGTTAPMTLTLSNLPLPMDYSTQDGKLSTIQSKMNYAMATATATAIDAEAGTLTLDATPTLQPQQALVKLTLQNNGGTAISPSSLTVNLDAAGGYSTINLLRYNTSNEGAGDWIYGGATYENGVITLPKAGGCGCGWKTEDWTEDLTKYTGATCTFAEPVSGNCQFFVAYQKAGSEDQQYSGTTVSDGATYAWVGIPSEATQILGIYFALNDAATADVKVYPAALNLAKIGGFTLSPNASEVYVTFKGTEPNSKLTLGATVSGTSYSYSATGVNFAEGSYYEQTVKLAPNN